VWALFGVDVSVDTDTERHSTRRNFEFRSKVSERLSGLFRRT
jgi:hypothetical protein